MTTGVARVEYGILVYMGNATALSVEEYLHTSFPDLDREYRDGEIVERTLPDYLHGKTQALLAAFFLERGEQLSLHPCVEARMRVRPNRFLIPDVAVFHPNEPDAVPETPPLVAIEILSPDDRLGEVREKLEDYRTWGVPHVWLADPRSRRFYTCDAGLTEASSLTVPELGIELTPHDLFKFSK
jgi:Uma2 family endonuclease